MSEFDGVNEGLEVPRLSVFPLNRTLYIPLSTFAYSSYIFLSITESCSLRPDRRWYLLNQVVETPVVGKDVKSTSLYPLGEKEEE